MGAGPEGAEDFFRVIVNGQDDEGGAWHVRGKLFDHFHSGDPWKFEVHDDNVRLILEEDDGLLSAVKRTGGDEIVVLFLDHLLDEKTEGGIILDHSDTEVPAVGAGGITGGRRRAHRSSVL